MLIILSPAKIQNAKPQHIIEEYTLPSFLDEAEYLINELRQYSNRELSGLLSVNDKIVSDSSDRYYNWNKSHTPNNSKQAVLMYNGEVYRGLDAANFSLEDFNYAQNHLRILSGLYGVLRPLDIIQPYRLEMATKLKNKSGNDLYKFWNDKITHTILKAVKANGSPEVLLNLASNEYFKTIRQKVFSIPVIHFDFLENKNGTYKPITVYTKKARGLMTRYIIQERIENTEDIKGFNMEGYWFNNELSTGNKFVFTRG